MMKRTFNIAGPCIPGEHYLLPALARCPELAALIQGRNYFVIHAARQAGKTTLLKALATEINSVGERVALYCSLESVQGLSEPEKGIPAILNCLASAVSDASWKRSWPPFPQDSLGGGLNMAVKVALGGFCRALGKPLVLLFDEADCLSNQTLITFLRQLRDGFINRADAPFPSSIALVGMRDIRDYKAKIRPDGDTLGSASPFNIITKSLTLKNFTRDEIGILYAQHTAETGQPFTPEAVDRASHWTGGQPWLVNAIARECVEEILARDLTKPVTAELMNLAAENLLRRRDTHLDSLYERLKEERVRRVVEPVMLGQEFSAAGLMNDDTQYTLDLGLLRQEKGVLSPANPIYAEVIARTLSYDSQVAFQTRVENPPWATADGLDMTGLLKAFQTFWRENNEVWVEMYQYKEAAPHLIMMAFLQRVINGGGQLIREYSLGRRRLDVCVIYAGQRYPVELKLWEGPKSKEEGMLQLAAYCDSCGATEGWLVFFDRRPKRPWSKKLLWQTRHDPAGHTLHFVGC
jgi:hypothetical protein